MSLSIPMINDCDDNDDVIVEFPVDRLPDEPLPHPLGRVDDSHVLRKPILITIAILVIFMVIQILISVISPATNISSDAPNPFKEQGAIIYLDNSVSGYFTDQNHQSFIDMNGKKYVFVEPHNRDGNQVSGHWRKISGE